VWRISSGENYLKLSVVSYPLASGLDVFVVALRETYLPVATRVLLLELDYRLRRLGD